MNLNHDNYPNTHQAPQSYPPTEPRVAEYQYTLVIMSYLNAGSDCPRDWCNLGTFVSFESGVCGPDELPQCDPEDYLVQLVESYESGFEDRVNADFYGDDLTAVLADRIDKHYILLPVYEFQHGGVAYNTSGFSCPWDSGQIGYIYVSKEDVRKERGWKRITKKRQELIEKALTAEIEVYSMWANGEVWGFELYHHDVDVGYNETDVEDSCWGFYHPGAPNTMEELEECGIACHLPDECLNESLVIEVEFG